MLSFKIRPADLADIPAIALIYGHAVATGTASFELEPPDEEEMAGRYESLMEGGHPYFVAHRQGRVLGYAYAGPYRSRAAYRNTVEVSVYVAPDARRQGIGGALLDALIAESEKRGFRQMVAVIGDSGHAASIGLHERHGFRLIGTLAAVGYKHGRWLDSVLMQRALGANGGTPPTR